MAIVSLGRKVRVGGSGQNSLRPTSTRRVRSRLRDGPDPQPSRRKPSVSGGRGGDTAALPGGRHRRVAAPYGLPAQWGAHLPWLVPGPGCWACAAAGMDSAMTIASTTRMRFISSSSVSLSLWRNIALDPLERSTAHRTRCGAHPHRGCVGRPLPQAIISRAGVHLVYAWCSCRRSCVPGHGSWPGTEPLPRPMSRIRGAAAQRRAPAYAPTGR
jgi:hypothetical protein